MKFKDNFIRLVKYGSWWYCVKKLCFSVVICCGDSMDPTLKDGDIILVNKFSLRASSYDPELIRDRVVILDSPLSPSTVLCKRVGATSTDSMVPKGCIYVLGDNREKSHDSRDFGPVPIGLVQGIVIYRLHPKFERIQ